MFDELVAMVEAAKEDAEKFYGSGNKAAGTRLRGAMMEISKQCKAVREEVQEKKNA
jgi:hypothetical protein